MKNTVLALLITFLAIPAFANSSPTDPETESRKEQLKKEFREKGLHYFNSAQTLYMEDVALNGQHFNNVFELVQARLRGVRTAGVPSNGIIYLQNQSRRVPSVYNQILIVVDGQIYQGANSDILANIIPQDISSITVYNVQQSSNLFGTAGSNGALIIMTHPQTENKAK